MTNTYVIEPEVCMYHFVLLILLTS